MLVTVIERDEIYNRVFEAFGDFWCPGLYFSHYLRILNFLLCTTFPRLKNLEKVDQFAESGLAEVKIRKFSDSIQGFSIDIK